MRIWFRVVVILVLSLASSIALLIFYFPNHWLREMKNFAAVTIDGRSVPAKTYLGNPTMSEAEAFVLVRIPGEGNFLFNFLDEDFREISSNEFSRVYRGAIIVKKMTNGPWMRPLDSVNFNEFRVVSGKGHVVSVQF